VEYPFNIKAVILSDVITEEKLDLVCQTETNSPMIFFDDLRGYG